jgi:hypothetical protein
MSRLTDQGRATSLANRSALDRRREAMDRTEATGWRPQASTPMMRSAPETPSHPSEGPQVEPPRAIHVTRSTHGGNFGRSVIDRVLDSYDG